MQSHPFFLANWLKSCNIKQNLAIEMGLYEIDNKGFKTMKDKNLKQQVVVITGATSGLGEELAKQYVGLGHKVYALARSQGEGNAGHFLPCDVTNQKEVQAAFEAIMAQEKRIDLVIANAGVGISGALELLNTDEAKKVFDVNVWGVFHTLQESLKHLTRGGKFVTISSACALFALPYRGMYCASKAAVNMLSYSAGMELMRAGIQTCAICPGEIKTTFTKNRIKNFATNERYGESVRLSAEHIDAKQETRMPVQGVARKIVSICNRKNLKPMVIIGAKYKALYYLQKFASTRLLLKATNAMFNKTKK